VAECTARNSQQHRKQDLPSAQDRQRQIHLLKHDVACFEKVTLRAKMNIPAKSALLGREQFELEERPAQVGHIFKFMAV
jgi:hypothetical protein